MAPTDNVTSNFVGSSDGSGSSTPVNVQSLNRVVEIPVVKSALGYAGTWYERVKGYNPVLESGFSRAEQTAQYVADAALNPVMHKLEKQISMADLLVCQGLDKLEEKVPAIKKSPDELKTAGWERIEEIKGYGTARVDAIRLFILSQLVDAVKSRVNELSSNQLLQLILERAQLAVDLFPSLVTQVVNGRRPSDESNHNDSSNSTHGNNCNNFSGNNTTTGNHAVETS